LNVFLGGVASGRPEGLVLVLGGGGVTRGGRECGAQGGGRVSRVGLVRMTTAAGDDALNDLQKRYRMMEGNKKTYTEDTGQTIRRQRKAIEQLKAENQVLKDQIAMETKFVAYQKPRAQEELNELHDQADMYTSKIELEKRRMEQLMSQAEMLGAKLEDQRKAVGGSAAARDHDRRQKKQVKILENRLDKTLKKFNEALSHNKKLRDDIDNLRRERVVFDQVYKKLEKELADKKKEMARSIEISNIAYEARDQAQNEMAALRAQADREQALYEAEWKDLGKAIKQAEMAKQQRKNELLQSDKRGKLTMEQEKSLRKNVLKGNWGIAKDKARHQSQQEKLLDYEETFARIKESVLGDAQEETAPAGETPDEKTSREMKQVDEFVLNFIKAEEANFNAYNYLNELNQDVERLETEKALLEAELESAQQEGGDSSENARQRIITDLEARGGRVEMLKEIYARKIEANTAVLDGCKVAIDNMYNKCGCDTPANRAYIYEEEGDSEKSGAAALATMASGQKSIQRQKSVGPLKSLAISDSNVIAFLACVERRANELIALHNKINRNGARVAEDVVRDIPVNLLGGGPNAPTGSAHVMIEPPSTADDVLGGDSDDEEGFKPLSIAELQKRTIRTLGKNTGRRMTARRR